MAWFPRGGKQSAGVLLRKPFFCVFVWFMLVFMALVLVLVYVVAVEQPTCSDFIEIVCNPKHRSLMSQQFCLPGPSRSVRLSSKQDVHDHT